MAYASVRVLIGAGVLAGLSACVPTTTTTSTSTKEPAALKAEVPAEGVYLATSDDGFNVPQVPVEKVPDEFERQIVDYETAEVPGTIVINPAEKHLYFVTGKGKAIRYGIAVGKSGFEWHGVANITNRKHWPTWTPPPEMIERKPELAKWEKGQPGGPTNPLGARALYLTTNGRDYGYRIHGTPDWWSIGKNASSGCIRMINQDVMDLYNRVPDGAKVIVLTRDGKMPTGLKLPPPAPKKKAPAATPAPAVATAAEAATVATPAASTAPADGPMSTPVPATGVEAATPAAVTVPAATTTPTVSVPSVTAPAAATPVVVTPAPAATTPSVPATAPTTAPAPAAATAPATAPTTPAPASACAVPLVNGVCPQN
ncbi:L,D-transpeptidase [Thioclava sp. FR2]|uniref:L,D-transpeptidase n=1 Tax=Thioclava sp. FR2 TaxID=3445780 RepID=UPI003EBD625A